ncbi:MAG TPA: bifunctional 5,10-methylenetetrahydrofolate dehydrogenase/5,10-methenyltetrahydrofolate cyclohydrolase [Verrucomicrobiae bacterium]|nr:bifunctional 5,10-methylenetetrahydrofolate dehydrogenase/5,10-methenyltetrahydrofolate cyclohydrolase [Verrucomicrobiae bacterium]
MSAQIVDGKLIADKILQRLKAKISKENLHPVLAVVLVGKDKPSQTYVRKKQEAAESIGVKFLLYEFPQTIKNENLVFEMKKIQKQNISGIIVQLPLPKSIDKKLILNQLDSDLDVDYLSWESLGKLVVGENTLIPPAPGAVLEILNQFKIPLKGKHIVLVGQGDLIGKPLTNLLMHMPVTLSVCNKYTKDLKTLTMQADVLITGAGKYNLIRGDMIKPGAVVIDAGVSFEKGKMHGDVNFDEIYKKAKLVTPTPGGVGPITVAKLLENTVAIAEKKTSGSKYQKTLNLKI